MPDISDLGQRRTAVVTGASRGIGLGIARHLARHGYDLIISSRSENALDEVAQDLRHDGAAVRCLPGDMANESDVGALVAAAEEQGPTLDALVLAAGVGTAHSLDGYPAHRYDKQVSVNLRAPFLLLAGCLPLLRSAASARPDTGSKVIALASIGGVYPEPGLAAYGAAKAGLVALCQSVNVEEAKNGVSACAISPGYVDTDMSAWVHDTIPPDSMISVDDIVRLVGAVLTLSPQAVVPHVVVNRASDNLYRA